MVPFVKRPTPRLRLDVVDLLTVYFAAAFFIPGNRVVGALGSAGRPSFLIGFGLFALWSGARLIGGPRSHTAVRQPLYPILWLYVLALLLSVYVGFVRGMTPSENTGAIRAVFTILGGIGVTLVALDATPSMDRIHVLLRRMSLIGLFSVFFGLWHYVTGYNAALKLNLPGLSVLNSVTTRDRFGVPRVFGTAYHAIEFGIVHSLLAGISVHVALHARTKAERRVMWIAAALHAGVATLSSSRSQVVALGCVVVPLLLSWRGGWRVRAALGAGGAVLLLNAVVPGQIAGLVDLFDQVGEDFSSQDRATDYPVALRAWGEYPVFGRGAGTWGPESARDYRPGRLLDNGWLSELITTGVFGVLCLAALLGGAIVMARRLYKWGATDEQRHLASLMAGVVAACAVTNYLFDGFFYSQFVGIMFCSVGIVGAMWRLGSQTAEAPVSTQPVLTQPVPTQPVPVDLLRARRTVRRSPARPQLAPPRGLGVARWSFEIPADAHAEFWERRDRATSRRGRLYRGEVGPTYEQSGRASPK